MRQRIVINLDGPKGGVAQRAGGKRRRWPRVLAILALLILIGVAGLGAGGFFWWRHYQTTPSYAMALLVDAAQRNDTAAFEKLINDEEVAKNMATTVSQKAAARYGYALNSSIQQRIDAAVPALLPQLKKTIHDEVVKDLTVFSAEVKPKGIIGHLLILPKFVTIKAEGDTATVEARMLDRPIELKLKRDAEQWQVVEVKDEVLVQHVVDNVMKELPAIGSVDANNPLLKKPQRKRRNR
ncbi:MAG TPA: hypothetical protein VFI24_26770 [Pyrinomonadaceae bacterium]|nr:hypothetical protein [Pyrinomonadaceae bacterium]